MEMNRHGMKDTLEHSFLPITSVSGGRGQEVIPDLYCYTTRIANVCFVGHPETSDGWILVDAGVPGSSTDIMQAAEERFGRNGRPKAIILTHGHFDHVGAAVDLVEAWGVPVFAHGAELPYLTGALSYPEPDGTVDGGLVAKLSPLFPNEPIDLGEHVRPLPSDGSVPDMPGWRWVHTPGHTPGHISLFRDQDRVLLAGDAFVTVKQESLYRVVTQAKELNGPPKYFTTDWEAARASVQRLEALQPAIAVTGHGRPMSGEELSDGLSRLAKEFVRLAVPVHGRYVNGGK